MYPLMFDTDAPDLNMYGDLDPHPDYPEDAFPFFNHAEWAVEDDKDIHLEPTAVEPEADDKDQVSEIAHGVEADDERCESVQPVPGDIVNSTRQEHNENDAALATPALLRTLAPIHNLEAVEAATVEMDGASVDKGQADPKPQRPARRARKTVVSPNQPEAGPSLPRMTRRSARLRTPAPEPEQPTHAAEARITTQPAAAATPIPTEGARRNLGADTEDNRLPGDILSTDKEELQRRLHEPALPVKASTHSNPKRFLCLIGDCENTYVNAYDRKRHMTDNHFRVSAYACSRCHRQYSRQDAVRRHQKGCNTTPCAPAPATDDMPGWQMMPGVLRLRQPAMVLQDPLAEDVEELLKKFGLPYIPVPRNKTSKKTSKAVRRTAPKKK